VFEYEWRNAVFLLNFAQHRYDEVYARQYPSVVEMQRIGPIGFLGPLVETFQDEYRNTNTMGFLHVTLTSRSGDIGGWTPAGWQPLTDAQSLMRRNNESLEIVRLEPNDTFVVRGRH